MLRISMRFPLGVYHAQSAAAFDQPEWPPSPVRLVGALLAAAHGRLNGDPEPDRALLQRLCDAPPPRIVAPRSGKDAPLRGATRWAPRNHSASELKTSGLSPRNVGRTRGEVHKVGTAVGDRPVTMEWPALELTNDELERLAALASDVTFVGTSRSPAIVEVSAQADDQPGAVRWEPVDADAAGVPVRVPEPTLIAAFDRREAARRSAGPGVEGAGIVPGIHFGHAASYAFDGASPLEPFDPCWWGDMVVLTVDRADSQLIPRAAAAYLVGRAVRAALLRVYDPPGSAGEAPAILRARDGDRHCAFVALPNVWHPRHADGSVLGVAVVLPHPDRVPDLAEQRLLVEQGLLRLTTTEAVALPGAGRLVLRLPDAGDGRLRTLSERVYREPSDTWTSVTPIVHSRWRTSSGPAGLARQVTADCADVGLPAPSSIEALRTPARHGAASRGLPIRNVPESWRGPLRGPSGHARITFPSAVRGPILMGRARHFGLGLCVPGAGHP